MENIWSIPNPYATEKIESGSFSYDKKLYFQDIECSMAHAAMLGGVALIEPEMSDKIIESLGAILDGLDMGSIPFDENADSIHAFLDKLLDERVEDASALLNSFRHENERTSAALRLYLRDEWMDMRPTIVRTMGEAARIAAETPGTRAAHTLTACAMMLMRDTERMNSVCERMSVSPLGAYSPDGAKSGIDRFMMSSSLGFSANILNSLDALTDCDFCAEAVSHLAIMGAHLCRVVSTLSAMNAEFGSESALRRLLCVPRAGLAQALGEDANLPVTQLGDMSQSAEALISSCESMKNALKLVFRAVSSLEIAPDAEKLEISAYAAEAQLDALNTFISKQNDGSGRY